MRILNLPGNCNGGSSNAAGCSLRWQPNDCFWHALTLFGCSSAGIPSQLGLTDPFSAQLEDSTGRSQDSPDSVLVQPATTDPTRVTRTGDHGASKGAWKSSGLGPELWDEEESEAALVREPDGSNLRSGSRWESRVLEPWILWSSSCFFWDVKGMESSTAIRKRRSYTKSLLSDMYGYVGSLHQGRAYLVAWIQGKRPVSTLPTTGLPHRRTSSENDAGKGRGRSSQAVCSPSNGLSATDGVQHGNQDPM